MAKGNRLSFFSLVIGGAAGFGLLWLTRRAWDTCRVEVNGVGNGPTLLFVGLPVALVVNIVLFSVVWRVMKKGGGGKFLMPLLGALIAITIADLALFSWAGTPATLPAALCPANVPPWWPEWIPT
ncbi:hypothetical protein Kfla_0293 [Kribbella flavida DSM 17836]|uniref:Uncharacterized protein n=1 Tax=Kribbella flavida (strain DSM 17836 / JCM 10339 / NBRC 14399) TaxID=479435 RepID=D2PTA1_KRIFD|nr:hypothetical protein [Kribbella flavida]ADB29417.1 hypothetical protein Kfla_0293 [Kribbella flavida DSM 17836]